VIQTLLPLDAQGLAADDEIFRLTTRGGEFEVERTKVQTPVRSFARDDLRARPCRFLMPCCRYLNNQLLRALQESAASELAARMTAMNNASDNASELIGSLSLL